MSTTNYPPSNPSPTVTRRPLQVSDNSGNASQRTANRRSLSVKLRDLFRKDSSASSRAANASSARSPAASVRQTSTSPTPSQPASEAPHLHAPTIYWPFGRKKNKPSTTINTSKSNKIKVKKESRKTRQTTTTTTSPVNISSPIYEQENQTSIYGQHFVPRSPQFEHSSGDRMQTSSTYQTTTTTTRGFRDYGVVDQTRYNQQVIVSGGDAITPPTYTSDRSRSPSMNRQRPLEYPYRPDRSSSPISIPLPDIDVIPTPPQKRRVDYTPAPVERPPTSSRPSPKSTHWKSTSSSTLNNPGADRTSSPAMDVDTPKLNAPTIAFGSTSSKKKPKKSKSKTGVDDRTRSTTTINNLLYQNPVQPGRPWASTYGSLPDAEIVYDSALTLAKPAKTSNKTYPGLSAIVQHHLRPTHAYYNERPYTTTSTASHRPRRFETSTTTLNEYGEQSEWPQTNIYGSGPITSTTTRHDGYIRPITPQKPFIQADITISRIDTDDPHRRSPAPRPTYPPAPESPTIYRSSTTVYTRDKHHYVDGGEIRTWSAQDHGAYDDYQNSSRKPYTRVEVERTDGQRTNSSYDHQIVPGKSVDYDKEHRYSPRFHERETYVKQEQKDHELQEEEECYEVSFEYERQQQQQPQYSYQTPKHYEELHSNNRYSNEAYIEKTPYASITSERDKIYDQSSRSYQHTQETHHAVAPVRNSTGVLRNCILKRRDSYDGLGILISADSQSRLNHFIREVEPNSPGHLAGLRKNDRIISINGINVENVDFSNVLVLIKQGLDNDNLQISVIDAPEHI